MKPRALLASAAFAVLVAELNFAGTSIADPIRPNIARTASARVPGPDDFEKAQRAMQGGSAAPSGNSTPEEILAEKQWYKESAQVTVASNGKTFTITKEGKFSVFLDDEQYPVSSLACEP